MTRDDLADKVGALLGAHPAVRSVTLIGSRARGDANRWSDWDLFVETDDFASLAPAVPALLESLGPLIAQWDRLSDEQCYMLVLPGPRKVDLLFDAPHDHEPPHTVSAATLASIDAHFWDWTLWLTSKVAAGKSDFVGKELAKMTEHLLGPLGILTPPKSPEEAVASYLAARAEHEAMYGVEVPREPGNEVMRVIADQATIELDTQIRVCRSLWVKRPAELEYYATPGPMTDLRRCRKEVLEGLPDTPADLMRVVRGCVVDGLPLPEGRDDNQIRPAAAMIDRILELRPAPLVDRREPEARFIGNCRHFATLTCALLRHKGVPTRVRAGFAGYFLPEVWMDHWIIEYWRPADERWIRVDSQYSDKWFQERDPGASSESVASRWYLSGGETWRQCRRGELDPNRCNMGGSNWGIGEVRGSVLYDLAALNQDEMLPWDTWGRMKAAYNNETDDAYDGLLDTVAAVTDAGDLDEIRSLYESEPDLRVPASLLPSRA